MNISDEAVEALARRNFEAEQGSAKWEQCWEDAKAGWRREARAQVEAITPHLMAQAWDEGEQAGYENKAAEEWGHELARNPYRSVGAGE